MLNTAQPKAPSFTPTKVEPKLLRIHNTEYLLMGVILFNRNTPNWVCKRLYEVFTSPIYSATEIEVGLLTKAHRSDHSTQLELPVAECKGRLSVSPAGQLLLGGRVLRTEDVVSVDVIG